MKQTADRALVGEVLGEIFRDIRCGAPRTRIGLMSVGSEHSRDGDLGQGELLCGALRAMQADRAIEVVMIGPKVCKTDDCKLEWIETDNCEADIAEAVNRAISDKVIDGAVALHFPFPLGVATIGRVVTPAKGREMFIASTTGTTATDRVEAMVKNAICGIAAAKSIGIKEPRVGVLNVDGAASALRMLNKLKDAGYGITFGQSVRADGGTLLRGNDLLGGEVDVCVTDTLTGNVLMKLFSSWNNGGIYEASGFGYGPSIGEGWDKTISIISRASGAPVIANAILYTAQALRGSLPQTVKGEFASAKKAGLGELLAQHASLGAAPQAKAVTAPPAEPTDEEIHGIDVLSLEEAVSALWAKGIYAEASMGCTGPVIKLPGRLLEEATKALTEMGYI